MSWGKCCSCKDDLLKFPWKSLEVRACPGHGFRIENKDLRININQEINEKIRSSSGFKTKVSSSSCYQCQKRFLEHQIDLKYRDLRFHSCKNCSYLWFKFEDMDFVLNEKFNHRLSQEEAFVEDLPFTESSVLLGLMTIKGVPVNNKVPWICISLIAMSAFFVITEASSESRVFFALNWAFDSSQPFRHWGLNVFTSSFIHLGWSHFIGNSFAMYLFGEHVEGAIGRTRFFSLLLLSDICSALLPFVFLSQPTLSLGMSGMVSGVIAFFCIRFTQASISLPFLFLFTQTAFRIWLPAFVFGLLYFVSELFSGVIQNMPYGQALSSGVGHLAHVGGALAGLIYATVCDDQS